jgi:hypothetical protein
MRCVPRPIRWWTALFLLVLMSGYDVAPAAAGLAPSRVSGVTTVSDARAADLLIVQRALEHKLVVQKLRDYGVAPADVQARLATMSDQDLHQLATASAGLPTGSDSALGVLVTVLIIILLVILIVKLMNKEIVVR